MLQVSVIASDILNQFPRTRKDHLVTFSPNLMRQSISILLWRFHKLQSTVKIESQLYSTWVILKKKYTVYSLCPVTPCTIYCHFQDDWHWHGTAALRCCFGGGLIEVWLVCNVMLVSGLQHNDPENTLQRNH